MPPFAALTRDIYDIVPIVLRLCCQPKPNIEVDNTNGGFDNSSYHAQTEFNNYLIYLKDETAAGFRKPCMYKNSTIVNLEVIPGNPCRGQLCR
jgi:hypothetical protein